MRAQIQQSGNFSGGRPRRPFIGLALTPVSYTHLDVYKRQGLALAANLAVAALLYGYRDGDSNRRGAWLCTRNDALGNLAVLLAALGVFGTGAAWPDLIVAAIMAGLALTSAVQVIRQARLELATV